MTAAAHQLVDEPQDDPADAGMPVAAFAVIQRAHEICGHRPAENVDRGRHLPTGGSADKYEACFAFAAIEQRAIKILGAQIRARELVREMKERGEFSDLGVSKTCLVDLGDENVRMRTFCPLVPDWQQVAQDAWHSEGWARAADEYQFARMRR